MNMGGYRWKQMDMDDADWQNKMKICPPTVNLKPKQERRLRMPELR